MPVPLLDVNAQNHPLEEAFTSAFQQVLQHGRFIMGPEIAEFEQSVADLVGVKHGIGVASGTDALLVAMMALDLGPGDEVLCPTFTFFATAGCIQRTGATPVFVDCCPVCFNVDVSDARSKITERTKAIVPVHLFGQSAAMEEILALASEHGLKVIEDAAQAIGAGYKGRGCGSMGDLGTYSFFPSKNLGGMGDSGMVVTQDDALADRVRRLRNHGMEPKYYHREVGGNFRMDTLQAAMLGIKLRHYGEYTGQRQANARYYTEQLLETEGVVQASAEHCHCAFSQSEALADAGARVVLPVAYPDHEHIWNQYTLRVLGGRRDALRDHLVAEGIGCDIYYPVTLDQQECFAALPESSRKGCQVAHQIAGEVLSIPIYGELEEAQMDQVIAALRGFLQGES